MQEGEISPSPRKVNYDSTCHLPKYTQFLAVGDCVVAPKNPQTVKAGHLIRQVTYLEMLSTARL